MIWNPPNRFVTVSPEELAAAMRAGLDARRHVAAPVPGGVSLSPLNGPDFTRMREFLPASGLRGTPPPRGSLVDRLVRPIRRGLKFLALPWLEQQTRANHLMFDHQWHLHECVTELTVRVNRLLAELNGDVLTATRTANARLNEFFHDVAQLRQAVAQVAEAGDSPHAAVLRPLGSPPVDPHHVIETLYLCSRVPGPPARVLVLAPVGLQGLNLANLGYDVVQYGLADAGLDHPQLSPRRAGGPACELPFDDRSFDVVVSLASEGESARGLGLADPHAAGLVGEVDRVLGLNGMVIGSAVVPADRSRPDLGEWLAPFEPSEVRYAGRAGQGWVLEGEPSAETELVLFRALRADAA